MLFQSALVALNRRTASTKSRTTSGMLGSTTFVVSFVGSSKAFYI